MRAPLPALVATVIAALAMAMAPAHAGDCSDGGPWVIRDIEAYARDTTKPAPDIDHLCVEDGVGPDPALVARFLAACTTIVARRPDDAACIGYSIELGATHLGTVDLFDAVGRVYKLDPFQYGNPATHLYRKLADARAVPLLRAAWQAALADKRARQPRHAHTFTVFRHAAIALMSRHGGADDAAFLTAQKSAIKDRGLRRAIDKALAAIAQRSTPAPP